MNKKNIAISICEYAILGILGLFFILVPYFSDASKIAFCFLVFFWLSLNILEYKKKFYKGLILPNFLNKPVGIFLLAGFISVIFSSSFYFSQSIFFERYLPYTIFFWISSGIIQRSLDKGARKKVYFLLGALFLSGLILGAGALSDYLAKPVSRIWTVFGKELAFKMLPVYFALFIPVFFFLLKPRRKCRFLEIPDGLAFKKESKKRIPDLTLKVIGFLGLITLVPVWVVQKSRAAWVSALVSIGVLLIIKKSRTFVVILLICLISLFFLPDSIMQRAKTIDEPATWGERVEMWKASLSIWGDFPVFGAGLGMFEKISSEYGDFKRKHLHAHNTYLELLAETGLVGVLAFIYMLLCFFRKVFFLVKKPLGFLEPLFLGLVSFVLSGVIFALSASIVTVGVYGSTLFWSVLGLTAGLIPMIGDIYGLNQKKTKISLQEENIVKERLKSLGYID